MDEKEKAQNQMAALLERIKRLVKCTAFMVTCNPDMSADKVFVGFLLTELAQENGLLDDNCNRAVVEALHAVGLEENKTPIYLQKKEA